ncbi:MAG: long-chain fatty acid--CoA ligase [Ectothiorhodospiraceae bacterium]|jgi:long-chain acyl-CoA synthetase|nr:long-chain fatty acid--CoA ligase [Ectothiorhodospiraceae bacterium]
MSEPITPQHAVTLAGLFRERARRSASRVAYRQYEDERWVDVTWQEVARTVARWQAALLAEGLTKGDRVALMLRNRREWSVADQAALGLGLVTVPLYNDDRPDSLAWILNDAGVKLLFIDGRMQWRRLREVMSGLDGLMRVVSLQALEDDGGIDARMRSLDDWLAAAGPLAEPPLVSIGADSLATLIYTSGTTGRPKGVMLTHANLLENAHACSLCGSFGEDDLFLSFLPLSHALERSAGLYLPMLVGAPVAYARSIPQLAEDLATLKPTVLISVPRIYEKVYARIHAGLRQKSPLARWLFLAAVEVGWRRFEHAQGRAAWHPKLLAWPLLRRLVADKVLSRLGGRLRYAVSGGAALAPEVARLFIGLGLPLYQGYGMTEASPTVSVNRPEDNLPASIGHPLPGVEVRIGADDELLTRSRCVMRGYWNDPATTRAIDAEGWLHTGDKARMDADGRLYITGRIKDIIVLSNGEKMPPADMEMAIGLDPLIEQVMVLGEGRPFLVALVVLNAEVWELFARELGVDAADQAVLNDRRVERAVLERMRQRLRGFPRHAQIRRVLLSLEPWTVDDDLLTPTMKMKRALIRERFQTRIAALYDGL